MRTFLNRFLLICFITLFSANTFAKTPDSAGVIKAYNAWCDAIGKARGNALLVVKYYAPHAILLPTLSDKILFNEHNQLNDYFADLTSYKDIRCETKKLITSMNGEDFAMTSGFYYFIFNDKDGNKITIPARFTFVYKKYDHQWLILQHHSSVLPVNN